MRLTTQKEIDRFWKKVVVDCACDCWVWVAATSVGYGKFHLGKQVGAHRVAYSTWRGEIPAGLHLDHLCRNTRCVNPAHLEPVTCRENLLRGNTFQAKNAAKTHCANGHEFTKENTHIKRRGALEERRCRACCREQMARYYKADPERFRERSRVYYHKNKQEAL